MRPNLNHLDGVVVRLSSLALRKNTVAILFEASRHILRICLDASKIRQLRVQLVPKKDARLSDRQPVTPRVPRKDGDRLRIVS